MWEEDQDFEILDGVEEYELDDDCNDDTMYSELDSHDGEDVNEDSDVFEYEANFYYDEEDD